MNVKDFYKQQDDCSKFSKSCGYFKREWGFDGMACVECVPPSGEKKGHLASYCLKCTEYKIRNIETDKK